jgi:deoxyribodipyrimidine photo-lyase
MSTKLPTPQVDEVQEWTQRHVGHLLGGDGQVRASRSFRGGQSAADAALAALDLTGYAASRNEVWPNGRRGASRLSPYLRHGLLSLAQAWRHAGQAPAADRDRFREELMWQEYARHLYARLGTRLSSPLRHARTDVTTDSWPWQRSMACVDLTMTELDEDGWIPNQARMWLASHWAVRHGGDWREGEQEFFRRLLDGSRAANRLGWQWTMGAGTGRAYGFSRAQVERRAPGLCAGCALDKQCPITTWPSDPPLSAVPAEPLLLQDPAPDVTAGPIHVTTSEPEPDFVWLTAESLGDGDPALVAHPDLPAVFVFDEPLLTHLQLHAPRLVFLAECLADLAQRRTLHVHLGDPVAVLSGANVATTFAPVPGWRRRAHQISPVQVHPWPWLVPPTQGPLGSFSAWRRRAVQPSG